MSNVNCRNRGFSLLELILYFGLVVIVVTVILGFAADFIRTREKARVAIETEQNLETAMSRILFSIRRADKLNVGASTFDNDAGRLSLQTSSTSTNPTVIDLSGGVIRLSEGSGTSTPLTTSEVGVTRLRFSRDNLNYGSESVTVQVAMNYNSSSTDQIFVYTTSASGTAVIRKQRP